MPARRPVCPSLVPAAGQSFFDVFSLKSHQDFITDAEISDRQCSHSDIYHCRIRCTVMPLRGILLSLLHECKWARGQLSFKAKEIECASCDAENC
jgi:hypothetical protein